jgi:hypothetical protein
LIIIYYELIFIFIGLFSGVMAGALGLGGGIIVVPGLLFFLQKTQLIHEPFMMHVAVATSLAVVLFTSLASLKTHRQLGEILWPVFYRLWPGIALGAFVGAACSVFISAAELKIIFTLFLMTIAIKMWRDVRRVYQPHVIPAWLNYILGFCIGSISALLGVGGGVLSIPVLTYVGVPARKIAPLANLCALVVALIGVLLFVFSGLNTMAATKYTLGYVYLPAVLGIAIPSSLIVPFGAQLNYIVPVHYLKYAFIVILILTAVKMLF